MEDDFVEWYADIGEAVAGKVRRYRVADGKLRCGWLGQQRFEFVKGNKYKVDNQNPAKALHKDAVGILVGSRYRENDKERICRAVLDCCGKRFVVDPAQLVPYDGEITEKHLQLISPLRKKVHLAENSKCVCKCGISPQTSPTKLDYDDFIAVPQNKRCANCNRIVRRYNRKQRERDGIKGGSSNG